MIALRRTIPSLWTALIAGCFALTLPTANAESRYNVGDPIEFEMTTTTGEPFSLDDLRGRLVVVDFWATLSEPSIQMIPHLKQINEQYADRGVVLISVSVDADLQAARRVIQAKQMDWLMVMNNDQATPPNGQFFAGRYGVPHAFLIAPDGKLLWNGHSARLDTQIQNALETHPPQVTGNAMQDVLTGEGLTELIVPDQVAKKAAEATYGTSPDFGKLFKHAARLPEDAHDQAKVKAFGRAVQRALHKLNPEQQEVYELYRTTYPDDALALDAWLNASQRSISDGSAGRSSVSPTLVASKFKQAEDAEADGDDLAAYELYRWIVNRAPHSDEAMLAEDVVLVLEADPDFMAQVAAQKLEGKAQNIMAMARNFAAAGHDKKATDLYEKVIKQYPKTQAAKDAAEALK